MLSGTREYNNTFKRIHKPTALDCVCIEPGTHRIYLKDPWLASGKASSSFNSVMLSYPSPEKLSCLYDE